MELKNKFNTVLTALESTGWNVGEVNYVLTQLILRWFKSKPKYQTINDIAGVFQCAVFEFYRRAASKLEDTKIAENGDCGYEDL